MQCTQDFAIQQQAFAWFWIPHIAKVQAMPDVAFFCDIEVCYNIFNNFHSILHCNGKVQKPRSPTVIVVPLRAIKYSSFRHSSASITKLLEWKLSNIEAI